MKIALFGLYHFPTDRATPIRIEKEAQGLSENNHEVYIICASSDIDEKNGVKYIPLDINRDVAKPDLLNQLVICGRTHTTGSRIIKQLDPDIIHGHNLNSSLYSATLSWRLDYPHVFEPHTNLIEEAILEGYLSRDSFTYKMLGRIQQFVVKKSNLVVTLTNTYKNLLSEEYSETNFVNIPGGVPPEFFQNPPCPDSINSGQFNIVYTGNFKEYQGVRLLIDSSNEEAIKTNEDIVYHLVTYEESAEEILKHISDVGVENQVKVHTNVSNDEIPHYMNQGDVLVSPVIKTRANKYRYPSKLSFYLAQRGAVIATDVGDQPSMIKNGVTGVIIPPDQPNELASTINKLYQNDKYREKIGHAGHEYAQDELQWTKLAQKLSDSYDRCVL